MKRYFLYFAIALVVTSAVIAAVLPGTTAFVEQWSRRDVELRSRLVANSIRDEVASLAADGGEGRLLALFERIADDERLLALGYCDAAGVLRHPTKLMPDAFTCKSAARAQAESFSLLQSDGRSVLAATFPIKSRAASGHLIILHDLSFVDQRSTETRILMVIMLAAIGLTGAALATIVAMLVMRRWLRSVRAAIDDIRSGRAESVEIAESTSLGAQMRNALRELNRTRGTLDIDHVVWTPDTLRLTVKQDLSGAEVLTISNREPYIHNREADGSVTCQTPASGLVAALEPVMRACGGTWIAHGSGSADTDMVDSHDRIAVPPASPSYTLRRVWLSEAEQDGYYYGFANEGLWPLCHIAFVRPEFRHADWQTYREVNQRFADAVVAETKQRDPIILIQDYHFALLPRMIRDRLPDATIITFWHIPWPNSESFGICPWKEEIIDGLLGSSILGFHTQFHCNNFLETVDRFVESRIDRERASVVLRGRETLVRPYPISIEWPPAALAGQKPVAECRVTVRERLGLSPDVRLGVGIERFDYTKGILDRMRAVDSFLAGHPEWRGRFVFVQVAAPTRSKLPAYRRLQEEAQQLADEINTRYHTDGPDPIRLIASHHEHDAVFELFRAADLCIVSSLHDGMNLVSKEFIAARDDGQGVLILSTFAGASRELPEALIVNPYDADGMGRAIAQALAMPDNEQRERMKLMRDLVRSRNVYRWAGGMLLDAARLRRRQRIRRMVASELHQDADDQ